MQFPEEFYYHSASSKLNYQEKPIGRPDFRRICQQHSAYWISPNLHIERQKKKLIFADWNQNNWLSSEKKMYKQGLQILRQHQFELYLWQNTSIIVLDEKLQQQMFDELNVDIRQDMLVTNLEDVYQLAAKQQLKRAEIFIIDSYWLTKLFIPDLQKNLSLDDFMTIGLFKDSSHLMQQIIAVLKESHPKINQLMIDVDAINNESSVDKLQSIFPQLESIQMPYRSCIINSENIETFLKKITEQPDVYHQVKKLHLSNLEMSAKQFFDWVSFMPKLEVLTIINCQQTDSEALDKDTFFPTLRQVEIRNSVSNSFLLATPIIHSSPLLESLVLHEQDITSIQLNTERMEHLKFLSLTGCNFDAHPLQQLLGATPQLEQLMLNNRHIPLDITALFESLDCQHLKVINLKYCYYSGQLLHLLSACPQLERLYLGPYLIEQDEKSQETIALPHLKQIEFEQEYDYPIEVLTQLIAESPHLESIHYLSSGEGFAVLLESACLPHLKYLGLSNVHFEAEQLALLLQHSLQLKHLSLSNCGMGDDLKIAPDHQLDLEFLTLNNCNFSTNSFFCLFSIMPNLSRLSLENNEYLFSAGHDLGDRLGHLNHLSLDNIKWETQNTNRLLLNNKNLKRLFIAYSKFTSIKHVDCTELFLPELEHIEIKCCRIYPPWLLNVINSTQVLENLSIIIEAGFDSFSLFPDIFKDLKPLSHLRDLHLSNVFISGQQLSHLLSKTPYLETLKLSFCSKVHHELEIKPNSLHGLTTLFLKYTDLSTQNLRCFKKAAPNLHIIHVKEHARFDSSEAIEMVADADTTLNEEVFYDIPQIFYPIQHTHTPCFSDYRLQVYDGVQVNTRTCSAANAFKLWSSQYLELNAFPVQIPQPKNLISTSTMDLDSFLNEELLTTLGIPINTFLSRQQNMQQYGNFYVANTIFSLESHWKAIPSLSSHEYLIAISCHPFQVIELAYHVINNQYFIRGSSLQTIELNYILFVSNVAQAKPTFEDKIKHLQSFQAGELAIPDEHANGFDYLDAIIQQKKGACRHRAIALQLFLQTQPKIRSRIIHNDCHAFVEVLEPHYQFWQRYDLGGYPTRLPKIQASIEQPPVNPFLLALATWEKNIPSEPSIADFIHQKSLKKLIEVSDESQAYQQIFAITAYCLAHHIELFIAHESCDLLCAIASIDEHGQLQPAPSGPMYHFLQHVKTPAVILINYSHFKSCDYARFNSLLDGKRHIDQISIPEHIQIIGVYHPSIPDHQPGADFFSRFDNIQALSVKNIPPTPIPTYTGNGENSYSIALFQSHDWQAKLLGYWQLQHQGFIWKAGELQQAIATGAQHIILQQAPWQDPHFVYFWQQALYLKKIITAKYQLSLTNIQIHQSNGYEWQKLIQVITPLTTPAKYILNPQTLADFISHYQLDEQQRLCEQPGFIFQHQQLEVLNTHSLNANEWAMLLDQCLTHQVTLAVAIAPGVQLPDQFPPLSTQQLPIEVFISDDIDVSLIELEHHYPDAIVIDISECQETDIIGKIEVRLNNKDMIFSSKPSFLSRCLAQDNMLLLKGQFSAQLSQSLAPWFLNHGKNIILLSEKTDHLNYLQAIQRPTHIEQKKKAFCRRHQLNDFPEELLPKLEQPLVSMQHSAEALLHIHLKTAFDSLLFETKHVLLIKQRIQLILNYLEHSPFVFLVGISGVGKTSLMQDHHFAGKLYKGETQITTWASTSGSEPTFLFLDEANLSLCNWSMFEGLFHQKPALFYQGQYFHLSTNHKVIFAGNPVSYGDERKLASLFSRHGRMITLSPFPCSVIFETCISPLFPEPSVTQHLLHLYQFVCQQSEKTLLISPREIQTICLLSFSYLQQSNVVFSEKEVVDYFAYHLAESLLPESVIPRFKKQFPPPKAISTPVHMASASTSYSLTPSRHNDLFMLQQWLNLRLLRKRLDLTHPIHNLPGLGGVILEGESGIGKSELLRSICHDPSEVIYISVSMQIQEKQCRLIDAFHQGSIVIMDEINSSPMMESTLNALLMGKTPDGEPALKPGFLLIGTQNPISYSGRCAPSQALARRLLKMQLKPYPEPDIKQILIKKGLHENDASQLTEAFHQQRLFAKRNHLQPAPNFRDVIRCAEQHLESIASAPKH